MTTLIPLVAVSPVRQRLIDDMKRWLADPQHLTHLLWSSPA